jgi:Zn-dependent protease
MLGWSTNLFRIRGIQLAVHGSFYLLLAWVAYDGYDPDGWVGVAWNIATVLTFFTCVVLHELGHSFTAMHFGIGVRRILLMPIGGMAEFESIPRQPGRELLITLAGPAVNFAIAGLLWLIVGAPDGWPWDGEFPANAKGFAQLLLHWNLIMGCFNLAPVFPMDGGRIFRAVLASRLPYLRATLIAATIGKVLAVIAALVAFFWFDLPLTALLFAFIFFAGEMEYRAARRREWEDAYWRDLAASLTPPTPPAEEPPLLGR